jgi:hypothetical protein
LSSETDTKSSRASSIEFVAAYSYVINLTQRAVVGAGGAKAGFGASGDLEDPNKALVRTCR